MTVLGQRDAISQEAAVRPRRAIAVVVLVAAVLLAADLIAQVVGPHLHQPQTWPTLELQHKYSSVTRIAGLHRTGVVLVGDSMLDADADPIAVDSRPGFIFNASLAGETLPILAPWATEIVVPRLHPRVVVLGFSANVLNADIPGEAALVSNFIRSRTVAHAEGRGDWVDDVDAWLTKHVALYRDRTVLRDPFSSPVASSIYDPPLSAVGWNEGFLNYQLGTGALAQATATAEVKNGLFRGFRINPAKVKELGSLIDAFRSKGIQVLLVAMPVSPYVPQIMPGGITAFQQAVNVLVATAAAHGARTANAGVWAPGYFADTVHLNEFGTSRFSTWLATQLSRVGA